jgi:hypothetical protein
MRKTVTALLAVTAPAAIAAAVVAPSAATADRGGQHSPVTTSSLKLVILTGPDQVPNWGEQITFDVSTTATEYPYVDVTCTQNSTTVYGATTGYFASYPWPWTQVMTLQSQAWTSGAADCTARLYYLDGKRTRTLASLPFHVQP